ncbi:MAG: cyclic nucleotide-binding domain-containing protein [Actinomycetota bacterium]
MATNKQIVAALEGVPLFSRCSARDLKAVARHVETIEIAGDRDVVRQGDDGDALFVVLGGALKVTRDGKTVRSLGPGDYFGELALLDPAPRAATVTALEDTELAAVSVRMFRVLLREIPGLGAKLLADLAARVRDGG